MHSIKILSLVLILTLSSTIFFGCKAYEIPRNVVIAGSAAGIIGASFEGLSFAFPGGWEEFKDWLFNLFNPQEPPTGGYGGGTGGGDEPPTVSHKVKYKIFIDETYGFFFDYPVEIDGKTFDGEPKIIAMLEKNRSTDGVILTSNVVKDGGVINIYNIHNNSGNIATDNSVVVGNQIIINGNGGDNNLNINNNPQVVINGNNVNQYSGDQYNSNDNENSSEVNPFQPKPEKKIQYRINLEKSTIYVGTNFCDGYAKLKSYFESQYSNFKSEKLNSQTFEFRYGNEWDRVFFGSAVNTKSVQRFYYVHWDYANASALDKEIAEHIFASFRATKF